MRCTRTLSLGLGLCAIAGCEGEVLLGPDGLAVESAVVVPTGPVSDSVVFTMTTVNVSRRTVALNGGDPRGLFQVVARSSYGSLAWELHPEQVVLPVISPPFLIAPGERHEWSAVWHLETNEHQRVGPGTYWLVGDFGMPGGGGVRSDSVRVDVVD